MTNIREFIKNLGDKAAVFFDTKETTVARWMKTGSIPIKAVEKVLMALEAAKVSVEHKVEEAIDKETAKFEGANQEAPVDPITHLPIGMDRRLPQLPTNPGLQPQVIEMSPTEQNWGVNLTRPGRGAPMAPMKIRIENGRGVPYQEQPKPVTVMPAELGQAGAGWTEPIPHEPAKTSPTEAIPKEKVS